MPVYNERETICEILSQVRAVGLVNELIVVDDCSTDGTREILKEEAKGDLILVLHDRNQGKGAAVRSGLERFSGDIVIIQDADLEYDPRDYATLIRPIVENRVKVVYGSRFIGPRKDMLFTHWIGNQFLTLVTNILFDTTLSDMETCYKVLKRRNRIFEVPISYYGREFHEGKKISWRDGFVVLWTLIKYRFVD
jgi:glycosyltransferase involved in cell wall biosynthesis